MTLLTPSTLDVLKDQNLLGTGSVIGRGGIETTTNFSTLNAVKSNTFIGVNSEATFNQPQTISTTETVIASPAREFTTQDFIGKGDAIGNGGRSLDPTAKLLLQVIKDKMLDVNSSATFNTSPLPTNIKPSTISVGSRFSSVVPVRPTHTDEGAKTVALPISNPVQKKRIKENKGLIKFPELDTNLEIASRQIATTQGTTQVQVSQEQLDIINAIEMSRLKPTRSSGAYTNKELISWAKSLGIKTPSGANKATLVYHIKEHIGKIAPEKLLEE